MVGLVANAGFYVLSQDSRTKGEGGIGGIQNIGKDYENIIKLFIFLTFVEVPRFQALG